MYYSSRLILSIDKNFQLLGFANIMFFSSYKLYSVHMNPDHDDPYEKAVFVKEGFNILALIFSGLWLLYQRIWISGLIIIILMGIIVSLEDFIGLSVVSIAVLRLGIQLMVGLQANDLLRSHLDKKGYIQTDMVAAGSLLEAQQRYFDRKMTASGGYTV